MTPLANCQVSPAFCGFRPHLSIIPHVSLFIRLKLSVVTLIICVVLTSFHTLSWIHLVWDFFRKRFLAFFRFHIFRLGPSRVWAASLNSCWSSLFRNFERRSQDWSYCFGFCFLIFWLPICFHAIFSPNSTCWSSISSGEARKMLTARQFFSRGTRLATNFQGQNHHL